MGVNNGLPMAVGYVGCLLLAGLVLIGIQASGVASLTKPDTSLDTLPVAYFGGVGTHPRAPASYDMLAKMRIVVIEKWEGPCWDDCMENVSKGLQCQPGCHGEMYMMDTLQRVKKANPKVATGYYQNTLYLWRYQALYADFAAHDEALRALNGSVAGLENDNGMQNVPVFSHDKPDDVMRYGEWLENLTATGFIDGTYLDKGQIRAVQNETTKVWQVCEYGGKRADENRGGHAWIHACVPISAAVAQAYNRGKEAVLNKSIEVFTKSGGFIMAVGDPGNLRTMHLSKTAVKALLRDVSSALSDPTIDYVYLSSGDDKRQDNGNDTEPHCNTKDVATGMLAIEEGVFLGCNGWSDDFSKPLGKPLGSATQTGSMWSRKFSSGTTVTLDESSGKAEIHWGTFP